MVEYDYEVFDKMINTQYKVDEIFDALGELTYNYVRSLDVDYVDQFKDDITFIEFLLKAFKSLKKQADGNNK
jgi:hypothetical protein